MRLGGLFEASLMSLQFGLPGGHAQSASRWTGTTRPCRRSSTLATRICQLLVRILRSLGWMRCSLLAFGIWISLRFSQAAHVCLWLFAFRVPVFASPSITGTVGIFDLNLIGASSTMSSPSFRFRCASLPHVAHHGVRHPAASRSRSLSAIAKRRLLR